MSAREWTPAQKQAITTRGGDLLISAAAGSGKTAVLTERVLTLITDPERPVDIDRLLIVTFSNAAAEEMRQRNAARLYERMEQEPENAVLRRQSLLLGNAEICTIHAFCYRLIRENFQALGLPGDMALGRGGEDELLQAAVLEQLLDEEYEKAEPAFMRLIELFSGSRNDRRVMASLLLLYRFLRNHPFYRDWAAEYITADTETPLDETIWSGLLRQRAAEALQYADDLLRDCMDLLGQSNDEMLWEVVTPVIMQDREMLARLMTAVTQEEWDIAMTRMLEASFPQFPRKKWTDAETKDTVLRLRRRAAEAVTELKTKVFLMGETQYREDQQKLAPLMERLCALGLVSAAGKSSPAPAGRTAPAADKPGAAEPKLVPAAELPQYTAEDIASRMLSDEPMQTVRREAEQLYGRKLTTPEMNMLLGLRDYLGLPADVLMELIHYVFQEYRAERGHAGTPTMRRIEKEAYAWADQEIHTTAQAEEYLQRRQARRELAQQVLQVLQIQDRAPSRTERGYITSWLDMGFGCDAIAEAYDRTVVATGARKWAYLNRILMSWHEKGLHTPEEIETGDPRAAGKRRAANPAAPAAERDDLDRVEQLLRKMEQTNT